MDAPRTRRPALALGRGLLLGLLGAFALLLSLTLHLRLPLARHLAATWLTELVSGEINGALIISSFDSLAPGNIVARDLQLYDARGQQIIAADRLVLAIDFPALLSGKVAFASARLTSAKVELVDAGAGLPTLLTTFDSPRPAQPGSAEPLEVTVNGIELTQVTLYGDLLGLTGFQAEGLRAKGQLIIGRDVRARIDQASAALTKPFGYVAYIDALQGVISTRPGGEGVSLKTVARRNREQASATVSYAPPPGQPRAAEQFELQVRASELSIETLHGLGYDWAPELLVPIAGQLSLRGPIEELALTAAIHTAPGDVQVEGAISSARGVHVALTTDGVELAELLPAYPEVHARGRLEIAVGPDDEQARVHMEVRPLRWGMLHVPAFVLDGMTLDDGLRIDRVQGSSRNSSFTGRGSIREDGRIALDLRMSIADIGADPNFIDWAHGAHGALEADVQVARQRQTDEFPSFSGNISVRDFRLGALRAQRLDMQGSARGDPSHPTVNLRVGGNSVQLGEYMLGDPGLTLRGGPRQYQADGQFVYAGRRTFNIDARVRAEARGFLVDADPIEFTVGDGTWRGALQGLHLIGNQAVELGLLRLASRSQRLEARGKLGGRGKDRMEAQLQDFDLAALRALVGDQLWLEQGRADARIVLEGALADPDLLIQGALREGVARDVQGIDAVYRLTYRGGKAEVNGEVDLGKRGMLRLDGEVDVHRALVDPKGALARARYALEASAERLDLDLLPALRRAGVSGSIGGTLRISGDVERPELDGALQFTDLALPGWSPLSVSIDGAFADGRLLAKLGASDAYGPLAAADADMHLDWRMLAADPRGAARTMMQGPWRLSGHTSERRLDAMPPPIAKRAPYPAALSARFDFHKTGAQTQGKIDFTLDWQQAVDEGGCAPDARARGHGSLTLDQGISRVALEVSSGRDHIASFSFAMDTPVDRWAEVGAFEQPRMVQSTGRLDVEAMQRVPYLCEYGDGKLHANLEIDGGLSSEPLLAMTLDTEFLPRIQRPSRRRQTSVRSCGKDPIRARVQIGADGQELTGSARMTGCDGGETRLQGRVAAQWDTLKILPAPRQGGALQARLSLDGAQLKPLLERIPGVINAEARARGEVSLSGTVGDARWNGQLGIESGRLYLVSTGQELSDLNAWLEFHGNWAKLESLQAKLGPGSLAMSGGIGFAGILPNRARLAIRVKDLPLKREGVEMASLTGNTVLEAAIEAKGMQAELNVEQLAIRLPEASSRALLSLSPHEDVLVQSEAPQRAARPYPFQFAITGGRDVVVQRDDFKATIQPALNVHYLDPDLRVEGYITFHAGEFEVFGKRFQVNTGSLRFDGNTELNPEVYLVATQKPESSSLSAVSVWVTGTMEQPEVTFHVDVCSGETAAISYLLSGQCGGETDDAFAQESSEAPAAFAAGVLGGVLTLGAQRELKGLAPRIAVESTEQGTQHVRAGFTSESLIPVWLRGVVQRVYIAGGVMSAGSQAVASESGPPPENTSVEFLFELYFAHNLVGSGRFAPPDWGLDVLWEP
jgi:autotransporter translocation and assembly factor TamB